MKIKAPPPFADVCSTYGRQREVITRRRQVLQMFAGICRCVYCASMGVAEKAVKLRRVDCPDKWGDLDAANAKFDWQPAVARIADPACVLPLRGIAHDTAVQ